MLPDRNSTARNKKYVILHSKIIAVLQDLTRSASFIYIRIGVMMVLCWCTLFTQAQLCTGSLGDPVVNITFGSGGGTSSYTPTSGYTYTSNTCPNDGFYTITNSSSNCFSSSWHTILNDHTGSGAFMLVNASVNPGDFFLTTVTDLCPNTTYEFAAWIMNVLARAGIKPNITFSIETPGGVILQKYSTGDIVETSQPTWKQYGFYFTTPASNPVIVLRMTNNAPGGLGNDLALDDITFRPCGKGVITSAINGNSDTVHVCEGSTQAYDFTGAITPGYLSPVFQWQVSTNSGIMWNDISGATSLFYRRTPSTPGLYWYRLTVTESSGVGIPSCRIASNVIAVNVHEKPLTNAGPDRIVFAGDSVALAGIVTGENPVYFWDPPDFLNSITALDAIVTPPQNMDYTLYATSAFGCKSNDAVFIKVVGGIYVPNAFTPNNDGRNDRWHIPFLDPLLDAEVSVFNRYGQLVYHVRGKTVDWDGSFKGMQQSGGVYVYHISFKKHSQTVNLKGTVLLLK